MFVGSPPARSRAASAQRGGQACGSDRSIVFLVVFVLLVTVALSMRGHGSGVLKRWLPAMHGSGPGGLSSHDWFRTIGSARLVPHDWFRTVGSARLVPHDWFCTIGSARLVLRGSRRSTHFLLGERHKWETGWNRHNRDPSGLRPPGRQNPPQHKPRRLLPRVSPADGP